jgi:hypothetical protein
MGIELPVNAKLVNSRQLSFGGLGHEAAAFTVVRVGRLLDGRMTSSATARLMIPAAIGTLLLDLAWLAAACVRTLG